MPSPSTGAVSTKSYTSHGTKRWTPALPCLLVLVLVLLAAPGTLGQPAAPQDTSSSTATSSSNVSSSSGGVDNTDSPGSGELFGWLLQRLQRTLQLQPSQPRDVSDDSDTDQADDSPDFASTANALTQQAVREANVRAAGLAQRTSDDASQQGSSAGGSSSDLAALQLLELEQQTANSSSSSSNVKSNDSTDDMEGLQLLLQTIRQQWEASRNRQRQQQQPASDGSSGGGARRPASPGEQWAAGLQAMAAQYPSLGGFARLAGSNSALQREMSQIGQLPSIIMVPTNAVLAKHLSARRTPEAQAAGAGLGTTGSGSVGGGSIDSGKEGSSSGPGVPLEQLVDEFNSTVDSLMLLRRHFVTSRQPHLLDSNDRINSQLLERGSNPLVFTSLVLKTSLGSYIQVSQLPQGPAAQRLADVVNPARAATAKVASPAVNSSAAVPCADPNSGTCSSSSAAVGPQLLHVGQGGSALARPFVLHPTNVLAVPVDTVLTEQDEVVNRMTAARLRGAFGWSTEDQQALLSAVYLDPDKTYWAQTEGWSGSRGDIPSTMRFAGPAEAQVRPGASKDSSTDDNGSISSSSNRGDAASSDGQSDGNSSSDSSNGIDSLSEDDSKAGEGSTGANSNNDDSKRYDNDSQGGDSNKDSDSDTAGTASSSGSSTDGDDSGPGSGGGPGGRKLLRRLHQDMSQASPAGTQQQLQQQSASSSDSGPGQGGVGPGSRLVPSFVAETRARQQQMLVQMQMQDALAANLMTSEAINAWISAAVLNPAAVFDADSLRHLPQVPADSTSSSSSGGGGGGGGTSNVQGGRQREWDCWLRNAGRQGRNSSQISSTQSCPVIEWSSTCINAPCSSSCSGNSSSSSSGGGGGAGLSSNPVAQPSSSSSSTDSMGQTHCARQGSCGRISDARIVGLSPYQLFPSLGLTYTQATSSDNTAPFAVLETQAAAPVSPANGSSSSRGSSLGQGRRGLRTWQRTSSTNSRTFSPVPNQLIPSALSAPAGTVSASSAARTQYQNGEGPPSPALAADGVQLLVSGLIDAVTPLDSGGSSGSGAGSPAPEPDDLVFMPVTQLALLLSEGTVTPQQLAAAFKDRLQRYDGLLNTAVTVTSALANSQAAAAAAQSALQRSSNSSGAVHSLLAGVPYGLKDLFSVPGYPTTWGLSALRNRTIDTPSWAYSALSGLAGGVLLAKTATGELAWGDTWFDNITTRNPWNVDTGSCGSSAGSAAAVAAGLLPFGVGSETWGSVVCPATTVGVSAYRPSGGTIPSNGLLQVSPTLDKTGIFCRQLLDCAVVADALMDTQASTPTATSTAKGTCTSAHTTPRLHRQDPAQAAAFNYTAFQQQLAGNNNQSRPALLPMPTQVPARGPAFPASFQELPRFSGICIGYLHGTSTRLLSVLRSLSPACVKGPLYAPGNPSMVRDVLPTIMQAEVAISYEGLWLEGFISQHNHWWPSIQLGQLAPAATYLRAQQLRGLLLQECRQYFQGHGIHVLLKPARSTVGLDGLAALLDMPEVLLPVEMREATFADAEPADSADSSSSDDGPAVSDNQRNPDGSSNRASSNSMDGDEEGGVLVQRWTQPKVNTILALPGGDAYAVAVGAAFQSVTEVHLQRPPLPDPGSDSTQARVVSG